MAVSTAVSMLVLSGLLDHADLDRAPRLHAGDVEM